MGKLFGGKRPSKPSTPAIATPPAGASDAPAPAEEMGGGPPPPMWGNKKPADSGGGGRPPPPPMWGNKKPVDGGGGGGPPPPMWGNKKPAESPSGSGAVASSSVGADLTPVVRDTPRWLPTPRPGLRMPPCCPSGPPSPASQGRQISEPLARKVAPSPGEEKPKKYIKQYEIGVKLGAGAYAKVLPPPHPGLTHPPRTPPPPWRACDGVSAAAPAHISTCRAPPLPRCPAVALRACRR